MTRLLQSYSQLVYAVMLWNPTIFYIYRTI